MNTCRHGKTFAAALLAPGSSILVADTTTGKERRRLPVSRDYNHCLALSPDGRILAIADGPRTLRDSRVLTHEVRLWDINTGSKKMPSDAPAAYPVDALLQLVESRKPREAPVPCWQHLVRRHHPWRQQLYIRGRNMTARQLVGSMKANQLDEEKTAADFHLPVEAVREAVAYVEANQELLETEAEIERLMLKRGGVSRGPQPVPG
jgi:uncharacterized protein (DUF433 family)